MHIFFTRTLFVRCIHFSGNKPSCVASGLCHRGLWRHSLNYVFFYWHTILSQGKFRPLKIFNIFLKFADYVSCHVPNKLTSQSKQQTISRKNLELFWKDKEKKKLWKLQVDGSNKSMQQGVQKRMSHSRTLGEQF